jgi:hypothetical protein
MNTLAKPLLPSCPKINKAESASGEIGRSDLPLERGHHYASFILMK